MMNNQGNQNENRKLEKLISLSEQKILQISTSLPLDLSPQKLEIDFNKVVITSGDPLDVENISVILIDDIQDVAIESSPLFSTLKITDQKFPQQPYSISYLKKEAAVKAMNIIQGLLIARREGINLSEIKSKRDLINKLIELGRVK